MTATADWKNSNQTYVNKKDQVKKGLIEEDKDTQCKNRKINELSSNIITHEDELLNHQRKNFDWEKKVDGVTSNHNNWTGVASNHNWAA